MESYQHIIDMEREDAPKKLSSSTVAHAKKCGILSAFSVVGNIATAVRMIVLIGLVAGFILTLLIAANILVSSIISIKVLYVVAVIELIAAIMIIFDASTAKWLIERVLKRLTKDVIRLESDLDRFEADLKESADQIRKRDEQLRQTSLQIEKMNTNIMRLESDIHESKIQLSKREEQLERQEIVQNNMKMLLASMIDANKDGVDLNELLRKNINKLEFLLSAMSKEKFGEIDQNQDGVISYDEFEIYSGNLTKAIREI